MVSVAKGQCRENPALTVFTFVSESLVHVCILFFGLYIIADRNFDFGRRCDKRSCDKRSYLVLATKIA